MVVLAAVAIAGKRSGVEKPEHMHGKRVLLRKLVHHDLQRELGKAALHPGDPVAELVLLGGFQRSGSIRHHRCQARNRPEERTGSRIGQATCRAFRGAGMELGLAKRATHRGGF